MNQMKRLGDVVWHELMTRDVARAREFYAGAFGWTFSERLPQEGDPVYTQPYTMCFSQDTMVAGIMDISDKTFDKVAEQWLTYFSVDNIDNRIEQAATAGAKILRSPFTLPGVGRIGILLDPSGAAMGWITMESRA